MSIHRRRVRIIAAVVSLLLSFGTVFPSFAATNEEIIFNYLTNTIGYNSAAACGILANIENESSFRTDVYGDNGTSYGICQWHDTSPGVGRFTNLKNFCSQNGLDYTSLTGQLAFLNHELSERQTIHNNLLSVENSSDGAYAAGYYWCYYFEIPRERERQSQIRGSLAVSKYWPLFGQGGVTPPSVKYEVWSVKTNVLEVHIGAGKSYSVITTLAAGRQLYVTQFVADEERNVWANIGGGWCEYEGLEWVSGQLYTLRFQTNCETVLEDAPVHYRDNYVLPTADDVSKRGYTLLGWDLWNISWATPPGYEITVYGDLNPKAVWVRDPSVTLIRGDANCDGAVNARDVIHVMKCALGSVDGACMPAADVEFDLTINARDVIALMKIAADPSAVETLVTTEEEEAWSALG